MTTYLKRAKLNYWACLADLNVLAAPDETKKKVLDLGQKLHEKKQRDEKELIHQTLEQSAPGVQHELVTDDLSRKREQKFLTEVENKANVWMHRFSDVKKDDKGFYILKSDNPAGNKMLPGQELADYALNMTPYWRITNIDGHRINLEPINTNPFKTGVGAGGAKITKYDIDVYTGENERKQVERINQAIENNRIDLDTLKYILLGTVPTRMGPNGAEGGWYNINDSYSNRGGRKGLTERDIMMADAKTVKEHGIPVPIKALDGTMNPSDWNDWVGGNGSSIPYYPKDVDKYVDFHKQMTDKGKYRYDDGSLQEMKRKFDSTLLDAHYDEMLKDVNQLSAEEWKIKYPYYEQAAASVLNYYKSDKHRQEKERAKTLDFLTEGETEEFDSILQNAFSKERRVATRNIKKLVEMCKEDSSYIKYLYDIINLGGAPDYLANEQIIEFFNLIDDIEGLKLCVLKLKQSDNLRYALSYLFQQGEEEFVLKYTGEKINDLEVINAILGKLSSQYDRSELRKQTFGRDQRLLDFFKQHNILDKLQIKDPKDIMHKHFVHEIISIIRRAFGPNHLWEPGDEELLQELKQLNNQVM